MWLAGGESGGICVTTLLGGVVVCAGFILCSTCCETSQNLQCCEPCCAEADRTRMSCVSVTCIRDGGVTGRRQAWCGVSAVPKSAWAELKGKNVGPRWRKTETRGDSDEKNNRL